jgi:hypothetical protein
MRRETLIVRTLWAFHAPPVTVLFLYLYEADFIHGVLKNFMHRYVDDVLSLNNLKFSGIWEHFVQPPPLQCT